MTVGGMRGTLGSQLVLSAYVNIASEGMVNAIVLVLLIHPRVREVIEDFARGDPLAPPVSR
jgi:hypothetical protein